MATRAHEFTAHLATADDTSSNDDRAAGQTDAGPYRDRASTLRERRRTLLAELDRLDRAARRRARVVAHLRMIDDELVPRGITPPITPALTIGMRAILHTALVSIAAAGIGATVALVATAPASLVARRGAVRVVAPPVPTAAAPPVALDTRGPVLVVAAEPPPPPRATTITRTGWRTWQVDRSELARQVRGLPGIDAGHGRWRFTHIPKGSTLDRMGIRNGDLLTDVSRVIADPSGEVVFLLERNGHRRRHVYRWGPAPLGGRTF